MVGCRFSWGWVGSRGGCFGAWDEGQRGVATLSGGRKAGLLALVSVVVVANVYLFLTLEGGEPVFLTIPFLSVFTCFLIRVVLIPTPFVSAIGFVFDLEW